MGRGRKKSEGKRVKSEVISEQLWTCELKSRLYPLPPHHPPHTSFFFFMIPRPQISTLFPYTTLFRSLRRSCSARESVRRRGYVFMQTRDRPELDRKSTRLNSSHVKISYAVFCLKK